MDVGFGAFTAGGPTVAGDRLYVATSSASREARHSGGDGQGLADRPGDPQRGLAGRLARPVNAVDRVGGSILVVPTDVGIAVAFDATTGREVWRFATQAFTDTPVIAADKVFLAGLDPEGTRGALWAVDLESGREVWHHTRPSRQTIVAPAVDPATQIVYAGTVDGDVIALRVDDGTEVWTTRLGAEIAVSPTKAGDAVYVAASGGITALDATTGQVLGTVPIDGIPSSPAVADGYLVAGTQSGTLYVLARAGVVPVSTPAVTSSIVREVPRQRRPLCRQSRHSARCGHERKRSRVTAAFYMNIAPDGRVWIADSARGRFIILGADGTVADTWQPTGAAALDLVQPDNDHWGAVAFAADGGFFVADTDHQRILRFNADRALIGTWGSFGPGPGEFVSPFGITVGPDGLVYVVDDATCRVEIFDPTGVYLRTLAGGPEFVDRCTNTVIVDRDGQVYLASGGRGDPWRITVFGPDGSVIRRIGEGLLREPVLIAQGPNGEIYATDGTDRLHLFDASGTLKASWSGLDVELAVIGAEREVYATGLAGVLRRYSLAPAGQP